jgi:plastocyanin
VRGKIALVGTALAALGLGPAALTATGGEAKPVRKVVKVGDDYFAPAKLTLPRSSTIVWRWPRVAGDVHDVYLARKPKGAKRFHSDAAASDYSFKRTLERPGRYLIVCTLHEEMTMTVKIGK